MAELFLQEGGELDRLEQLFESTNAPMKYELNAQETEKMKKRLESIVDKNGEIDEKAASQLKESDPDDERDNKKVESVLSPAMQQAAAYESRRLMPVDKAKLEQFS